VDCPDSESSWVFGNPAGQCDDVIEEDRCDATYDNCKACKADA
jgi:hypothetical protein